METATTTTGNRRPEGPWISGIVPPICTPFTADLEVDVSSLERLIAFLIEEGVTGLFFLGSSGETAFLTDAQRDRVVEVAVKTVAGQVPVLAGVIDMTTSRMIDHAARAMSLGADAIVATAPFYAQVTEAPEVERHFRALKAACGAPLLAYDIPVAVHSKLRAAQLLTLAADHVIDGLKDSSGDLAGYARGDNRYPVATGVRRFHGFRARRRLRHAGRGQWFRARARERRPQGFRRAVPVLPGRRLG